ncbi:ETC complex I subunit conserved region domain-containing protein [Ditylenchus destructor]|nr:ETC complex I subunit conserved region domain-containing protein [Ditylenchus destructor]
MLSRSVRLAVGRATPNRFSVRMESDTMFGYGEMYTNPFVRRHNEQVKNVPKDYYKQTTGITGLYVNANAHHFLRTLYNRILFSLQKFPENSSYRVNTEQIIKQRLDLVNGEPDVHKLEEKIGMGQIEEVIEQAENELQTARILSQHKVWEPIVGEAPEGQWRWPIH